MRGGVPRHLRQLDESQGHPQERRRRAARRIGISSRSVRSRDLQLRSRQRPLAAGPSVIMPTATTASTTPAPWTDPSRSRRDERDQIDRDQLDDGREAEGRGHAEIAHQLQHDEIAEGIQREGQHDLADMRRDRPVLATVAASRKMTVARPSGSTPQRLIVSSRFADIGDLVERSWPFVKICSRGRGPGSA